MAEPQLDYVADVERYASSVDTAAIKGIVNYLGIVLQNRDSSLVAAGDPEELKRVRESFMKKKLGLAQTDAELNAALNEVMTTMSGDRSKGRVTVYYLLAEKFGKLALFGNPQPATTMQPTKGSVPMPVKTPRELFMMLLSNVRQNTERSAKIYQEISLHAQDPDLKEALESRVWIVEKDLSAIDRCFVLMGEKPVQLRGHLQELLVEDFRKELSEMETPAAKAIFILSKANRLNHARIAEYEGLVEAADVSGHYGVGVLLESCLADKLVFVERTRRFIRNFAATKVAARVGA